MGSVGTENTAQLSRGGAGSGPQAISSRGHVVNLLHYVLISTKKREQEADTVPGTWVSATLVPMKAWSPSPVAGRLRALCLNPAYTFLRRGTT